MAEDQHPDEGDDKHHLEQSGEQDPAKGSIETVGIRLGRRPGSRRCTATTEGEEGAQHHEKAKGQEDPDSPKGVQWVAELDQLGVHAVR